MEEVAKEKTYLETIQKVMSKLPIVSSRHISLLFPHLKNAEKAASKYLTRLLKMKIVEGMRTETSTGLMKIWRLSKQGMLENNAQFHPVPLNSMKVQNYLGFADVYFTMGQPKIFQVELREALHNTHFDPDIFTIHNRKVYLIEVQVKPLSQKEWGEKWKKWNVYFNENHYLTASWQKYAKSDEVKKRIPEVVVITKQVKEQVASGWNVLEGMKVKELIVTRDIKTVLE